MNSNQKIYSIPFPLNIFYFGIPLAVLCMFVVFVSLVIGISLKNIILGVYEFNINAMIVSFVMLIVIAIVIPMELDNYSVIKVSGTGLYVRSFSSLFKWRYISWENIIDVGLAVTPGFHQPPWIIHVAKGDFWHKLLSFRYFKGYKPCIAVHPNISDSGELIEIIQNNIVAASRKN